MKRFMKLALPIIVSQILAETCRVLLMPSSPVKAASNRLNNSPSAGNDEKENGQEMPCANPFRSWAHKSDDGKPGGPGVSEVVDSI